MLMFFGESGGYTVGFLFGTRTFVVRWATRGRVFHSLPPLRPLRVGDRVRWRRTTGGNGKEARGRPVGATVMDLESKNLNVKEPRTSKMVNIDVTDVSKTKPRCFDVFFQKTLVFSMFFKKNVSY